MIGIGSGGDGNQTHNLNCCHPTFLPFVDFFVFFFAGKNPILDPTAGITATFSESRASSPNPPHESRRALWGVTCDLLGLDRIRAAVTRMRLNHITVISAAADVLLLRLLPAAHHPCVYHGT